jgi:hypothetical protein
MIYRVITNYGWHDCYDKSSSRILAEYHTVNADWPDWPEYRLLKTYVTVKVGIV